MKVLFKYGAANNVKAAAYLVGQQIEMRELLEM